MQKIAQSGHTRQVCLSTPNAKFVLSQFGRIWTTAFHFNDEPVKALVIEWFILKSCWFCWGEGPWAFATPVQAIDSGSGDLLYFNDPAPVASDKDQNPWLKPEPETADRSQRSVCILPAFMLKGCLTLLDAFSELKNCLKRTPNSLGQIILSVFVLTFYTFFHWSLPILFFFPSL